MMCVMLKVIRPKLVDEKFMKNLGKFLCNVQSIDAGSTQIQSAAGLCSSLTAQTHLSRITQFSNCCSLYSKILTAKY